MSLAREQPRIQTIWIPQNNSPETHLTRGQKPKAAGRECFCNHLTEQAFEHFTKFRASRVVRTTG